MMKIIGPVVTFVDRPWKMYPVGVLFGFGWSPSSVAHPRSPLTTPPALLDIGKDSTLPRPSHSSLSQRSRNATPTGDRSTPLTSSSSQCVSVRPAGSPSLFCSVLIPESRLPIPIQPVPVPLTRKLRSAFTQLLFTVGMTLIDSLDSIIMLYSYAGFPERTFAIFERPNASRGSPARSPDSSQAALEANVAPSAGVDLEARSEPTSDPTTKPTGKTKGTGAVVVAAGGDGGDSPEYRTTLHVKRNAMSNLSIILTTMSIVVAFR